MEEQTALGLENIKKITVEPFWINNTDFQTYGNPARCVLEKWVATESENIIYFHFENAIVQRRRMSIWKENLEILRDKIIKSQNMNTPFSIMQQTEILNGKTVNVRRIQ